MSKTKNNHYVPEWHQKGFFAGDNNRLHYLCLNPNYYPMPDGGKKIVYSKKRWTPSQCFYQTDLYTTFFNEYINDEIERKLFGQIDNTGSKAVRAYINNNTQLMHENFENLFTYLDAQKLRTPKGLDWIKYNYPNLNQQELMLEMQAN